MAGVRDRKITHPVANRMNQAFVERYRCPAEFADFTLRGELSKDSGFFRFGPDAICYGQGSMGFRTQVTGNGLYDAFQDVAINGSSVQLNFDPTQVIENLQWERYTVKPRMTEKEWVRSAYYLLRPLLPLPVRKYLQRSYFRDWRAITFPSWPVDTSVERILERLLCLLLKAQVADRIPFIWFWPDGYNSCAMVTHDVETASGLAFCPALMDMEDSFGIKSSFEFVPEGRYAVSRATLELIRDRGFEINIHDFNHDGRLFWDRNLFLERALRINQYAEEYNARGFRSGIMYRNPDWYDAFSFSYDMSIPNVAHLEPQRGGCCTVLPFFIDGILELPLTASEDYSLFHILGDYSIELWKQQLNLIGERHGLASFLVHPDYIIEKRARKTYSALLDHLSQLRSERGIWMALPGEVNDWWRQRSEMSLVREADGWRIEGAGKERARIAYATRVGDQLSYVVAERR